MHGASVTITEVETEPRKRKDEHAMKIEILSLNYANFLGSVHIRKALPAANSTLHCSKSTRVRNGYPNRCLALALRVTVGSGPTGWPAPAQWRSFLTSKQLS